MLGVWGFLVLPLCCVNKRFSALRCSILKERLRPTITPIYPKDTDDMHGARTRPCPRVPVALDIHPCPRLSSFWTLKL